MHFIFCYQLLQDTGWGTFSLNYINLLKKKNIIIICNKKNSKIRFPQYELLRDPLNYVYNPLLIFFDLLKIKNLIKKNIANKSSAHFIVEPYILFLPFISNFFVNNYFYCLGTYSLKLYENFRTKLFFLLSLKKITHVFFVSNYTKSKVLNKFNFSKIAKKQVLNLFYHFRIKYYKPSKLFYVLSVGTVKERKGFHNLIEVANIIVNKLNYNIIFYVAGEIFQTEYFKKLKLKVIDYKLSDNFLFLGKLNKEKLDKCYQNASLFIMLSEDMKDYFEGFGLVYLEALARGREVIISNQTGATDLKKINKHLFISSPKDYNYIAKYIVKIFLNKNYINHNRNLNTVKKYKEFNLTNFEKFFN
jgi:glycosyltransferase involved in cell wall biosynthesis